MGVRIQRDQRRMGYVMEMASHSGDRVCVQVPDRYLHTEQGARELLHQAEEMRQRLMQRAIVRGDEKPRMRDKVKVVTSSIDRVFYEGMEKAKPVMKKIKKKLGFYEKLEKEADEWLADVALAA